MRDILMWANDFISLTGSQILYYWKPEAADTLEEEQLRGWVGVWINQCDVWVPIWEVASIGLSKGEKGLSK